MRMVAGAILVLAGVVCIVGGLVCEAILEAARANRAAPTFFTYLGGGFLALSVFLPPPIAGEGARKLDQRTA